MRRIMIVAAMLGFVAMNTWGLTGTQLRAWWGSYQHPETTAAAMEATTYVGYIIGVIDALSESAKPGFLCPKGVTGDQLANIVGQYLDDHPVEWSDSTVTLIHRALRKAFPS